MNEGAMDSITESHQKEVAQVVFDGAHAHGAEVFGMEWLHFHLLIRNLALREYLPRGQWGDSDIRTNALIAEIAARILEKFTLTPRETIEHFIANLVIPNGYGMSNEDALRQHIKDAIGKEFEGRELYQHLCNDVALTLTDTFLLHGMYEDRDLEGSERAYDFFKWLDSLTPGAFVLIDTGDYLIPDCEHGRCETYDAYYRLFLMPRAAWEKQRENALAADRLWRESNMTCKHQEGAISEA